MPPSELTPELQSELDEALFSLDELLSESPEEALLMFQTLPDAVRNRPEFQLTRARALQQDEQLKESSAICQQLLSSQTDPELLADIHHLFADVLEDLGDDQAANDHFKQTLELDRRLFSERRHLSESLLEEKLTQLLAQAVSETQLQGKIKTQRVELFPQAEDIEAGLDPRAFSAYSDDDGDGLIRVFGANLDAEYGDLDELDEFEEHVREELKNQLRLHFDH